jgi:hypothetical protein
MKAEEIALAKNNAANWKTKTIDKPIDKPAS